MADDLTNTGGGLASSVPTVGAPPTQEGQAQPPAFMDMLPAEFKEKPYIQNFAKSDDPMGNFLKSYESAQSMLGKRVEIPGADATPEMVKAFHKLLGVPEKADGYEYKAPDLSKEPEAVQKMWASQVDAKLPEAMKAIALEAGLNPKQFGMLAGALDTLNLETVRAMVADAEAKQVQTDNALREQFNKFYGDKADSVEKIAKETASKMIPPEVAALGADIALIHVLHAVHEKFYSNDSVSTSSSSSASSAGTTKDAIQDQIWKLRDHPAYEDKLHPQHASIFKQVDELYKQKHALGAG